MKFRAIPLIAVLTALVAATVMARGASAAESQTTRATVPLRALVIQNDFGTLDDAIVSGKLDRAVVETLRKEGSVDALVTVRYTNPLYTSSAKTLKARAAILERTFETKEAAALAAAGDEVDVLRPYDSLPTTFVRFESADALLDVLNAPDVQFIRANTPVPVALETSLNLIRQPQVAAAGRTGAGTYVAVLDTGLDYTRAAFGCTAIATPSTCKVAGSYEVDGDTESVLDEGSFHGTNVSGIVVGVAPGTKVYAYDVFDWKTVDGQLSLRSDPSDQLAAIQHVINLKKSGKNIVAINMSLGGGKYTTQCNAGLNFSLARDWGIIPVVAAGNSAAPGGQFSAGIASPACDTQALSVGAVYKSNQGALSWQSGCSDSTTAADKIVCFSQTGSYLGLLAPGALINAAGIQQGGTSQAAPHVAGAVAVLAAAKYGSQTYGRAGAQVVESALRTSGPSIYDARIGLSFRRLDVAAAVNTLLDGGGGGGGGDTAAPVVTTPVEQFDGQVSTAGATVKISWSATDASGIAQYALYARTNGGAWTQQSIAPTATSARFVLAFGSKFEFAVQAKDGAGNWSTHAYSPALTPSISDDSGWPNLNGWSRYSWAEAYGGTAITATAAGTSITHTFTGRDVALVAPRFSTAGRAKLYCDGALQGTFDFYSSTLVTRDAALWCRFATVAQHTMQIVLEGTSGRPRIDVDAFASLR